ncbi:hypothetical protein KYY02_23685 [Streptomyces pimonensis]|uniref:OmpR/PhoB-type domain-containing protein n=1 Tax=Streptomyces pimonensis TaxID=2860288 RepID=A0ABV4J3X5_9ACTN
MSEVETSPRFASSVVVPGEEAACPVDVVLTLDRGETSRLLRRMRGHRVLPALSHPWGSPWAYLALLRRPDGMVLLDVPDGAVRDEIERRVRVLSGLSSVVVLAPRSVDAAAVLRAGAVNVMARDAPSGELACRIAAERRWLEFSAPCRGPRTPGLPHPLVRPRQVSQRVLLEILCATTRPWCCHDLCLLLGTCGEPVSRRALQARVVRLGARLERHGISIGVLPGWGRTVYTGIRGITPHRTRSR